MFEFIESYFTQNFMGAESNTSYTAGMNFTNLLIAIPIIATILLMYLNSLRSKPAEYAINSVNDCRFILLTLIVYVPTFLIFTNLFGYQLSVCTIFIMILGYIPFVFLSSCIYEEYRLPFGNQESNDGDNNSYAGDFTEKIKRKIQEIKNANKAKNILINGSWGAGKSHFIEKHLIPTQSLIYISCTDYADTHELISALITKTNNCLFRWLFRLSISRLLAVLGKYELKEFIGVNKVIVFDEFERLFDYNKIDPMHIVSLIQYLNNQKNCICILVANEDHLNNASQFNNVREKLISYIYRYKVPLDEVLVIIQEEYLQDTKMRLKEKLKNNLAEKKAIDEIKGITEYNRKLQVLNDGVVSHGAEKIAKIIDLNVSNFDELRKTFQYWYQIDNNIRMMKHLYIKINELYQATHQMVHEDDFYKKHFTNKVDELFSCLSTYINTVIIQLYYLYLKNPYFLTIIEKFTGIYHDDTLAKTDESNAGQNTQSIYFRKNSLQQLAVVYIERKDDQKYSDFTLCFKEILSNEVFANVNQKLVTEYFEKSDFILSFLNEGEIVPDGMRQNLEYFVRKFKETVCESDDSELLINYFRRVNVLEEKFLKLVNKIIDEEEKQIVILFDGRILEDYIAYCQYINDKWPRSNPNNIRPVSYRRDVYINALMVKYLLQHPEDNKILDQLRAETVDFYKGSDKQKIIGIQNELTIEVAIKKENIQKYIQLISHITTELIQLHKQPNDYLILLNFIYQSYFNIKDSLTLENIQICNDGMIKLSLPQLKDKKLADSFFQFFANLNNEIIKSKPETDYIKDYITKVKQIIDKLSEFSSTELLLNQMIKLYTEIKKYFTTTTEIELCNEKLIDLLTIENKPKDFMMHLFSSLSSFNSNGGFSENFPESSLTYLVDKIKAVFNTQESLNAAIIDIKTFNNKIAKGVIVKLQEDLDKQNNQKTE